MVKLIFVTDMASVLDLTYSLRSLLISSLCAVGWQFYKVVEVNAVRMSIIQALVGMAYWKSVGKPTYLDEPDLPEEIDGIPMNVLQYLQEESDEEEKKLQYPELPPELRDFESSFIMVKSYQSRKKEQKEQKKNHPNNRYEDELELIPCPFCAVPLTLDQLDHINDCEDAIGCSTCNERFPLHLIDSHFEVCKGKSNMPKTKKKWKKKDNNFAEQQKELSQARKEARKMEVKGTQVSQKEKKQNKTNNNNRTKMQNSRRNEDPFIEPRQSRPRRNIARPGQGWEPVPDPRHFGAVSEVKKEQNKGMKNGEIDELITDVYYPGCSESECAICMIDLEAGEFIIRLPCLHVFHRDCLIPWLKTKSICPSCKNSVKA